jgi:hypothetical protein
MLGLTAASATEAATAEGISLPSQVIFVDWLQCLSQAAQSRKIVGTPLRLSIVVAAWDLVPADQQAESPEKYVDSNFPMLVDFLSANETRFAVKYFGASVAGGDFNLQAGFRDAYLEANPNNAGYVVHVVRGTLQKSSDHTLPIAWALGLDSPFAKVTGV